MSLNSSSSPIGVFDSGIGGTSIWKEINALLPKENTIYLADSKNAPYGIKEKKEIIRLSIKNTELLLEKGCKLIVVACNTATTNAIKILRKNYSIPFIGIEPAIKPASIHTKTRSVGILATKGTLSSELFYNTIISYRKEIEIIEQEGTGIVELIEQGRLNSIEMEMLLQKYLRPMIRAQIDYLVLGCSHYPYLIPILKKLLPKGVTIIDSGRAVARQTKSVLEKNGLLNDGEQKPYYNFYTNRNKEILSFVLGKKYNVSELDF